MFEFIKEALDQMTFFIKPPITSTLNFAMFTAWNDSSGLLLLNQVQNVIHVIASIRQNRSAGKIHALEHFIAFDTIMLVSSCKFNAQGVA
ncbi:hypothetical protein D3C81_2203780 [compost metagenome]